jgi:hypothetical protein
MEEVKQLLNLSWSNFPVMMLKAVVPQVLALSPTT